MVELNKKQRNTLTAVFEKPTRADVRWSDVRALVEALDGQLEERSGSRVALILAGRRAIIHAPHPGPTMKKTWVEVVRDFLSGAGARP